MVDVGVHSQDLGEGTLSGVGIVNGNEGARVQGGVAGMYAMPGFPSGSFAGMNSPAGLASSQGSFWACPGWVAAGVHANRNVGNEPFGAPGDHAGVNLSGGNFFAGRHAENISELQLEDAL